ncbi:E3 ubiquitin-protein ligase EL5 [Acorus gramineus]|uniref:E3 ubiquitin-protein ligase EL5 n=1 Tax=Acorus gramineus TaxID=55184 RepID=A0AAV9BC47_ACOGR|nr:E3 ubiquitin-protein ligase EL5 [Acorus gramineus]
MGFPIRYSELLIHLFFLLSWLLHSIGLGDLLTDDHHPPILGMDGCDDICAVCLCDFGGGVEQRRLTNCGHVFHRECLDRWVGHDRRTCPLCRATFTDEGLLGSTSASAGARDGFFSDFCFTRLFDDFLSPLTNLATFSTF